MIALNESDEAAAEIWFFLPDSSNLPYGLTGHSFADGEVKLRLPSDGSFSNATLLKIIEKGYGWYALRLTPVQCRIAGVAYLSAVVAGAQPAFVPETISTLGGDIAVRGTGYIPFFLPDHNDPVNAPPITSHAFSTGEVRLCLPDATFVDADVADVVTLGHGGFALLLDESQTGTRGKAGLFVDIGVSSQPYSTFVTILGVSSVPAPTPPDPVPTPVLSPTSTSSSLYLDHVDNAFSRLCEMFKGG